MKTRLILGIIALVMVASITTTHAQRRMYNNQQGCLLQNELTQEQKDKMDELRVAFYQKTKDDKNKLNELMAKKQTLETTDPIDKKALYDCLASINKITANIQKERVRHYQDVKSNLSDEQIIMFDARHKGLRGEPGQGRGYGNKRGAGYRADCPQPSKGYGNQGQGNGRKGNGQGYGRGNRNGNGQGQGPGRGLNKGRGQGQGLAMDLTDSQKEFVSKSRMEMMAKEQDLKNKLNEMSAQIKTQTTGKEINIKEVDQLINQQAELRLKIAQVRADHKIEVRNQLTDEQKAIFDSKKDRGRRMHRRS